MKAELKTKWLEALRGETYAQGRNVLRRPEDTQDSFCCLGVLCDLVDPDGWRLESSPREGDRYEHGGYVGHLPVNVRAATGISGDQCFTLMSMNDGGKSFAQIADWIETNIPAE